MIGSMISSTPSTKSQIKRDTVNITHCFYKKLPVIARKHKLRIIFTKEIKNEFRYVGNF